MSGEARRVELPPALIVVPVIVAAAAAGRLIASGHTGLSVGLVLAIPFVALVFINLNLAIAAYAALLYVSHLSILSVAPNAIGILLVIAWFGAGGGLRGRLPTVRENQGLLLVMVLFGVWLFASAAWATYPGASTSQAGIWVESLLLFLLVSTTVSSARDVRTLALAFILGAVVSVLLGLVGYGGPTGAVRTAQVGDRLTGGGGDPNEQAAAFAAAIFLAGGLVATARTTGHRRLLVFCLGFITVGFLATQSRGGLLSLAFAVLTALVLMPEHRSQILRALLVAGIAIGVWVLIRHDALSRLVDIGGGTSGRADQWTIAWRMFKGHPLAGVGLDNFSLLEPRYALLSGRLTDIHLVAETPELVHNSYLQFLTETGVIGLGLFLTLVAFVLRRTWQAIEVFERLGERGYASLTRAVLIAIVAMLSAVFFLTDANDLRLWILFALGVSLSTLARRHARQDELRSAPVSPAPAHRPARSSQAFAPLR